MTRTGRIRGPEEIKKLWARIGDTPEKVLRWILRFANTDWSKQSEGKWLDFGEEFREFLEHGPQGIGKNVPTWPGRGSSTAPPRSEARTVPLERSMVEEYQTNLRAWLEKLVQEHSLEFESMPITLYVYHPKFFAAKSVKDSDLPEVGLCFPFFKNEHQVFAYHVAHLLGAHSGRLRRCGECQTIFLKDRRQQVFCSVRCLNRVTQRRWRDRKKQRAEKKVVKSKSENIGMKGGSARGKTKR